VIVHKNVRILVLGGYGNVGRLLCETLAKNPDLTVIVAGRSFEKAQLLVDSIQLGNDQANSEACKMDWESSDFFYQLAGAAPQIVIQAAGPYQDNDYTVPQTCIDLKIHYIDLADVRDYVTQIIELDAAAKLNNVVIISGASLVPGLSSAVVEKYAEKFGLLREIDFGLTPANQVDKGEGVIRALLRHAGKPFQRLERGEWREVYGWQNVHRHYYGDNLGLRWHANMDIPDLDLFPKRYPMLKTVVFHAGFELPFLHWLMWNMSWLSRVKLVDNWSDFASPITRFNKWFKRFGSNKSGMYIHMYGSNQAYQPFDVNWTLISEGGHGEYLPIVGPLILIDKILAGKIEPGARPCMAMFTLEEFEVTALLQNWKMYSILEEKEF
jgi:saccharopine dehydrogenase-like NADP-dependent oxidoreductase